MTTRLLLLLACFLSFTALVLDHPYAPMACGDGITALCERGVRATAWITSEVQIPQRRRRRQGKAVIPSPHAIRRTTIPVGVET